ncbi:hypothetical protein IV203_008863 [Nitzschia inconspicua]|uniref:Uncharacterized protein n=1 Tax=Nitzschia inconspicua TaxID=303405 RepID=A0A9K3L0W7_9STRA|nr:hypothetical protein IV203_008863 [Nitzschia inconspicua]
MNKNNGQLLLSVDYFFFLSKDPDTNNLILPCVVRIFVAYVLGWSVEQVPFHVFSLENQTCVKKLTCLSDLPRSGLDGVDGLARPAFEHYSTLQIQNNDIKEIPAEIQQQCPSPTVHH